MAKENNAQIVAKIQVLKDYIIKSIDESLNEFKSFTTQIFQYKDNKYKQIGTGFYLCYKEHLFLISAAHVFDDAPENERFVFNERGDLQKITGTFYKHKVKGRRDDDLKDLIAIEVTELPRKHVIKSDMINSIAGYQPGIYAFIGYPGTKNGRIFGKRVFKNRPYLYFDKSLEAKEITSFQYDDDLNVLIRYQYDKTIANGVGPNKSAKMKGISGGPVFWISPMRNFTSWNKQQLKLVGVVIHTLEKQQYMAAARLKILFDYLDGKKHLQDEFDCFNIIS